MQSDRLICSCVVHRRRLGLGGGLRLRLGDDGRGGLRVLYWVLYWGVLRGRRGCELAGDGLFQPGDEHRLLALVIQTAVCEMLPQFCDLGVGVAGARYEVVYDAVRSQTSAMD